MAGEVEGVKRDESPTGNGAMVVWCSRVGKVCWLSARAMGGLEWRRLGDVRVFHPALGGCIINARPESGRFEQKV